MKGFLVLILCMKILRGSAEASSGFEFSSTESNTNIISSSSLSKKATDQVPLSSLISTTIHANTASTTNPNKPNIEFFREHCLPVLMVSGGMILVCAILLFSTLLLTCKVCQLSRRLKLLGSNNDLISTSDYCVRTAKTDINKSKPEAKETSMLMSDFSQTQEDMGNGTAKEEGGKKNEDGQMEEEDKNKVDGMASADGTSTGDNKVETPASSTQRQEDTPDSQSTNAEAESSSGGTEEPKDVV